MKIGQETLLQFVVKANGGYAFCVLRILVGVAAPTFVASRPPYGWAGEFACGAVVSFNIALFVIAFFVRISRETSKICDELIEMGRENQQKRERELTEFYESCVADVASKSLN